MIVDMDAVWGGSKGENVEKPLVLYCFFARLSLIDRELDPVTPGPWGGERGGASPPQQRSLINQAARFWLRGLRIRGLEEGR